MALFSSFVFCFFLKNHFWNKMFVFMWISLMICLLRYKESGAGSF